MITRQDSRWVGGSYTFNPKELCEIKTGYFAHIFNAEFVKSCKTARRLHYPRRFVAAAAKRNRRQVRAIGFDEQPVKRKLPGDIAQVVGLLEGEVAGK